MATQTGSIDLEATNAAKLYAEAGFTNAAQTYATKSELTVSANQIRGEVAETYATKDEAALELSGSGTVVVLDEAADARLKALTIHGLSVQDGTPTPSAPVAIQSVQGWNLLDDSNIYNLAVSGNSIVSNANYRGCYCKIPTTTGDTKYTISRNVVEGNRFQVWSAATEPVSGTTVTACFTWDNAALTATFTVPANQSWLFVYLANNGGTFTQGNIQITAGAGRVPILPYGEIGITETGNNLLNPNSTNATTTNTTKTVSADGTVSLVATENREIWYGNVVNAGSTVATLSNYTNMIPLSEGESISVKTFGSLNRVFISFLTAGYTGISYSYSTDASTGATFTAPANCAWVTWRIGTNGAVANTTYSGKTMVVYGDTATAYEPYSSTTTPIPVTLRSLPDGTHDEWVSGESADTLVQRVGVQVFDGSESWTSYNYGSVLGYYTNVDYAPLYHYDAAADRTYCSAFAYNPRNGVADTWYFSSNREVNFKYPTATTVAEWKAYLAGNPLTIVYELATPVTTTLTHVTLPYVHDGDSVWVDAQVTPNIDVAYWSENGETVSALSSTLTQTAAGLELQLQGKVDSSEEWVSWMHAGTDPTTHEPYLAMGQDSDYPSVVYGSDAARFYDGEGDAASNVVASFGADGAVVGKTGAAHFEQTSSASKWYGSDGATQLAEITTENNYPMFWLKDSMRRVIAGQMTYLGISDTEYSDYINMESYGVSNNHDAEVNLIASGTSGTAKFKVADTVPIATESTPANMLLTPSVLKLSVGYEQEGGTATLDATAKAAWLAALGLDVQSSNMTFASGLNSSYGSAPVRKCGAMGILKLNSVRLASQLASGGSVVIGTLPTGYIPQGSVDMHINIESNSSNYRNNYIIIEYSGSTNPGRVTLYNRSGYAIPNTVTFSCTCPFFI